MRTVRGGDFLVAIGGGFHCPPLQLVGPLAQGPGFQRFERDVKPSRLREIHLRQRPAPWGPKA